MDEIFILGVYIVFYLPASFVDLFLLFDTETLVSAGTKSIREAVVHVRFFGNCLCYYCFLFFFP